MSTRVNRPFPRAALLAAGAVLAITVAGVGAARISNGFKPPVEIANGTAVETRALRFVDQGDGVISYAGHVRVFDARTGTELPALKEDDGFVRAVLSGLAFERRKAGVTGEPVFNLVLWSSHRMTLEDPATAKHVVLGAFGADNKAVFLRFLEHKDARS